jgi:hypothetical protein
MSIGTLATIGAISHTAAIGDDRMMIKLPVASPQTEGRTFGTDWSIANVATLLRSNAGRGMWRESATGTMAKVNQNYLRTVSARHLPTRVSLIFLHLDGDRWYASLCFTANDEYLPWNDEVAELWIRALFDANQPEALPGAEPIGPRQFLLDSHRLDPASLLQ